MSVPSFSSDPQIAHDLDGVRGNVRVAMQPDELLVQTAARLLDRCSLPLRVRQDLHSLRRQTRRVAANRSGFALVVNAMQYAANPSDALYFPRLVEAEAYGRCQFPTIAADRAHELESEANHLFDVAQLRHRDRRSSSTLDELLTTSLLQEVMTKAVAISESSEMRVRSVLVSR